jgi:hypothetical protein
VSVQIHLLARPAFDVGAVLAFLTAEGLEWRRSAAATPAEEIVEIGGRVCYLSFSERQSLEIKALSRNSTAPVLLGFMKGRFPVPVTAVSGPIAQGPIPAGVSRAFRGRSRKTADALEIAFSRPRSGTGALQSPPWGRAKVRESESLERKGRPQREKKALIFIE